MTPEQLTHITKIIHNFTSLATAKYQKGQEEHGGDLWKKKGLIDQAIDEAIDQIVYLLTIKQQLQAKGIELGELDEK